MIVWLLTHTLMTDSEQPDLVPGGTASQSVGGTGGVEPEDVQPKQADDNPNPRVTTGTAEKRDGSPSRQSSGATSEAASLSQLSQNFKEVGEQISSAMGPE